MKEEPFLSFCEKAWWELAGILLSPWVFFQLVDRNEPAYLDLCFSATKSMHSFQGTALNASSVQRVPEYLTFLTAVLVLFLFQMLIAGTHKYSGRTWSVSCSVGELTCYLLGYVSGFVGCFHM